MCETVCYCKVCRHLAASIAAGICWRIGKDCFKQRNRADGFPFFCFTQKKNGGLRPSQYFLILTVLGLLVFAIHQVACMCSWMGCNGVVQFGKMMRSRACGSKVYTHHRKSNDCSKWLTALLRLFWLVLHLLFCTRLSCKQHYARSALER